MYENVNHKHSVLQTDLQLPQHYVEGIIVVEIEILRFSHVLVFFTVFLAN